MMDERKIANWQAAAEREGFGSFSDVELEFLAANADASYWGNSEDEEVHRRYSRAVEALRTAIDYQRFDRLIMWVNSFPVMD